jgi:hypothetical protein
MSRRVQLKPRMRPRFDVPLAHGESERLIVELIARLQRADSPVQGRARNHHVELTTCARDCHVWSPRLSLNVEKSEDGHEFLLGQFSPHPNVWTSFMALYGTLAISGIFGLMFGISQWTLDMTPWGLLAVPISLALMGFTHGASFIGQGLGADEMYAQRAFVDEALRAVRGERQAGI